MARKEKKIELRPVEDALVLKTPVFRLESDGTRPQENVVRLKSGSEPAEVSQRLDFPSRDEFESRTHQPGIDELIGPDSGYPDLFEEEWGKASTVHKHIPWGWFALIGLMLVGAVVWSLTEVSESDSQAVKAREQTATVLENDAEEELEAARLVERIQSSTKRFFEARSIEEMLPLVRQVERVRPLMEDYYSKTPVVPHKILRTLRFEPRTIDNRASFWLTTVELENHEKRNLIIEVEESGDPQIDWETLVCYQPMDWDRFARERPENESLDFRVYAQLDNFYSHEFSDSSKWACFRLTALGAEETVFGYANGDVVREIIEVLNLNQGNPSALILRISIPEDLRSRNGVVIEKLINPRWIFVDPPDSGS